MTRFGAGTEIRFFEFDKVPDLRPVTHCRVAAKVCHRAKRTIIANLRVRDETIVAYLDTVSDMRVVYARSGTDDASLADRAAALDRDIGINNCVAADHR